MALLVAKEPGHYEEAGVPVSTSAPVRAKALSTGPVPTKAFWWQGLCRFAGGRVLSRHGYPATTGRHTSQGL